MNGSKQVLDGPLKGTQIEPADDAWQVRLVVTCIIVQRRHVSTMCSFKIRSAVHHKSHYCMHLPL